MNEEPAARTRAKLEKTKGRHRAKIEILTEILNWIELGKSYEEMHEHCGLSLEYHRMQVDILKEQIRGLFKEENLQEENI